MAGVTLSEFLHDRTLLAIKISSDDLKGFFRKALTLPLHTAGLALFRDGTARVVEGGQEVSGGFDLVLAKRGEIALKLQFPDLRTADGLPLKADLALFLELSLSRVDLFRDFCRALFSFPGTYSIDDLKAAVLPGARRMLAEHGAGRPAAELHGGDAAPLAERLRELLERQLFDAGVRLSRIAGPELACEEHARRTDERRRAVEVMDRKEQRLKRLSGILKDQEVQGLLARVPDERLKGLLYARLMEDDALQISAQDLLSKAQDCGEEVVGMVYRAMEGLLSNGASVAPEDVPAATADRLFAAAGSTVFEFDPARDGEPKVHEFPEALRSVREAETPDGLLLLGGTKRCVSSLLLGERLEILDYPLPGGRAVKGGVNSIAVRGRDLFATHSEHGLARWDLLNPGRPAELLYDDVTSAYRTTRSVQDDGQGGLVFASGPHVYRVPAGSERPVKYVSSAESPVTCCATAARTVFAGTEGGSIVCWRLDAPDQPVVLVRKRDAIVNVRLARICGIPHLLYTAKDLAVRARVIGQNLETAYETEGAAVGALDASSDVVCASDAEGRRVLLWKATAPAKPERRIDVFRRADRPVLDVWLGKRRSKTG
jgi:hypothetical protein